MAKVQEFTDKDGETHGTTSKRDIAFIRDMENAGIPWRWYSGRFMFGRECPAVGCGRGRDFSEEDVIRATKVRGLRRDSLGLGVIVYTG